MTTWMLPRLAAPAELLFPAILERARAQGAVGAEAEVPGAPPPRGV